ncbi:hypothetical protein V8C42DRAFT_354219 [Trichoderma barbatum]
MPFKFSAADTMSMDIVNTNTNGIKLPLLVEHVRPVSDSIVSNTAIDHTGQDGVDTNSMSSCDVVTNHESAHTHAEAATKIQEQTLLNRVHSAVFSVSWGMEIIAMVASFVCMSGLVCVLALFQNKPLTDWSFWISLNAVVAIAATASKATLLTAISACLSQEKWQHFSHRSHCLQDMAIIDSASRGPLGSMQMLFKVSWGFASLSAIITILSLATDAFVQQVTNYESNLIYNFEEGTATFLYTHGYSGSAIAVSEDISNHSVIYWDWTVDTLMQAAILTGAYDGTSMFSPISYTCISNCTWDAVFTSLGFGSICTDVTEETMATMDCLNSTEDRMMNNCELVTPGGVHFNTSAYTSDKDDIPSIGNDLAVAVGASDLKYDIGPVINGSDLFRTAVWIWDKRGRGRGRDGKDLFMECSLGVAIYRYSNISSIQYEFTIGATDKIPLGNNSGTTIDRSRSSSGNIILWWNSTSPDLPDIHISLPDLVVLADFFNSPSFSGGHSSVTSSGNYHPGTAAIFQGCTHAEGDLVKSCISQIFDRITTSMTSQLLQSGGEIAQGLTSQIVVYIRVRWVWLILPLVVQFLGGIALVVTIIGRKRTKNVPLWKASTLAVLYHSVDENGVLVTRVKDPRQLEEIGGTVKAVLDQ